MKTQRIIQNIMPNKFINRTRPEIKHSVNIPIYTTNKTTHDVKNVKYTYSYPYTPIISALILK
jgi:hypothetical protein